MKKNVFAFCNQKGGVGKTTSAVNLSAAVGRRGRNVLVIDLDSQGNATSGFGIDKNKLESTAYHLLVDNFSIKDVIQKTDFEGVSVVPANSDLSGAELELIDAQRREYVLREKIESAREDYDYIMIDCPPSLGLISINSLTTSNYVIIPLQCEYYALEGLGQLLNTYRLVNKNLNSDLEVGGVLLTMADFRTNLTQQVIEEVRQYFEGQVFESVIPRSVRLSEAPSFGKPAVVYDPASRGSKAYEALADEFLKKFEAEVKPEKTEEAKPAVLSNAPLNEGEGS